jgi:hypothetical protein
MIMEPGGEEQAMEDCLKDLPAEILVRIFEKLSEDERCGNSGLYLGV